MINQNAVLENGMVMLAPVSVLNQGNDTWTNSSETMNEANVITRDSIKNCITRLLRCEPIVLRIPTSFALFSLRAVEIFMKLMQAIIKTSKPMMLNIFT